MFDERKSRDHENFASPDLAIFFLQSTESTPSRLTRSTPTSKGFGVLDPDLAAYYSL